jgi:hypothetical protein
LPTLQAAVPDSDVSLGAGDVLVLATAVSLKGGVLEYKMSYPSTDSADFVYKYLENNL